MACVRWRIDGKFSRPSATIPVVEGSTSRPDRPKAGHPALAIRSNEANRQFGRIGDAVETGANEANSARMAVKVVVR